MDPRADYDPLVAGITFAGSLLSFIATSAVLVGFVYYRQEQQSFRHALVFNLALAEFINTLNNTISGAVYIRDHTLWPSTACVANGMVGQLSVQAADFSILTIAVVTLLTITRTTYLPDASAGKKVAICLSVWVVPIITTTVATVSDAMGPVSGNWCWILSSRTDLRYSLTHGWRIAIIFCTAAIYIFVWWFMHRHFRSLVSTDPTTTASSVKDSSWSARRRGFKKMKDGAGVVPVEDAGGQDTELSTLSKSRISRVVGDDWELSAPEAAYVGSNTNEADDAHHHVHAHGTQQPPMTGGRRQRSDSIMSTVSDDEYDDSNNANNPPSDKRTVRISDPERAEPLPLRAGAAARSKFDATRTAESEFPTRRDTRHMEREIKRVLLLNAYPIMYVVLWIPGLVNRFMEATGNKSDSRVLAALQASSQFVGLANALTYGFNTALRTKVKRWWRARKRGRGAVRKKQQQQQQQAGGERKRDEP